MNIAITADCSGQNARVPHCYEQSPWLLIMETDGMHLTAQVKGPDMEAYLRAMLEYECEALVCGPDIGQAAFDPIAGANITRFDGAGLLCRQAVVGALYNTLPFLREYKGGPGCLPGNGCHDHD